MVLTLLLLLVIGKNDRPIIIELPATKYLFKLGSAELPEDLKKDINGKDGIILRQIEQTIQKIETNNKKVEVIEVVGHTDGQPVTQEKSPGESQCKLHKKSSLDEYLEEVAIGNKNIGILYPCSNADLGLMRALAVVKELQTVQQGKDGRLKKVSFRAYSAAQLLLPENKGFAKPEPRNEDLKRRRIEIRFTQLSRTITPENNSK